MRIPIRTQAQWHKMWFHQGPIPAEPAGAKIVMSITKINGRTAYCEQMIPWPESLCERKQVMAFVRDDIEHEFIRLKEPQMKAKFA